MQGPQRHFILHRCYFGQGSLYTGLLQVKGQDVISVPYKIAGKDVGTTTSFSTPQVLFWTRISLHWTISGAGTGCHFGTLKNNRQTCRDHNFIFNSLGVALDKSCLHSTTSGEGTGCDFGALKNNRQTCRDHNVILNSLSVLSDMDLLTLDYFHRRDRMSFRCLTK